MNNTTINPSTAPDINPSNYLGLSERRMLMQLFGPQPRLDYPTQKIQMSNGCMVEQYIIPNEDREAVLKKLYPFMFAPTLDTKVIDLHTDSAFIVRDYLVIREGNLNFLATPRYAEAGGTVLDWLSIQQATNSADKPDFKVVAMQTIRPDLRYNATARTITI